MKDLAYNPDEPIVALATPWGESALAVIRTSGEGSIDRVAGIFSAPESVRRSPGNAMVLGELLDGAEGAPLDQVVLAVYRAPRSYTGQECVEIFCHGSPPGIQAILAALKGRGFRDAGPGEFTLRAFLNRKMDLTRAEAVQEIVRSKSKEAHAMALHRLSGAIEKRIGAAKERIARLMAAIEVRLDYPEDEVEGEIEAVLPELDAIRSDLRGLQATYRTGRIYQEGVRVALCGRTNAGKSSLFNLLAREERSIVSEIHGTTRDYIEAWITIEGIPVGLYDTAGLRSPGDAVEAEGIRRSERVIESCDLVVYLVDATLGMTAEDVEFLASRDEERCVRVWNKVDASSAPAPSGFLPLSALDASGTPELASEIKRRVAGREISPSADAVIDSARQHDLIERCVEALGNVESGIAIGMPLDAVALDVREALDALGEITGEVTTADILNSMFSSFCVGK